MTIGVITKNQNDNRRDNKKLEQLELITNERLERMDKCIVTAYLQNNDFQKSELAYKLEDV